MKHSKEHTHVAGVNLHLMARTSAVLLCCLLGISLTLTGCSRDTGETELKKRVELYWQYRVSKEADKLYDLEYPVLRNQMDRNTYIRKFTPVINYEKPRIEGITFDEDGMAAQVRIRVLASVKPKGAKNTFGKETSFTERWVRGEDKIWYHVPTRIK